MTFDFAKRGERKGGSESDALIWTYPCVNLSKRTRLQVGALSHGGGELFFSGISN